MLDGRGIGTMCLMGLLAYVLMLISRDQPLPTPRNMYYFQPSNAQAVLAEGHRLDEQMMLAAAEQKQQALAAGGKGGRAGAGGGELTTANTGSGPRLNYSRGLMVYDLVFEEADAWLEGVVDRVQLWNKLFLRQQASRNWQVSLLPHQQRERRERQERQGKEDYDEVREGALGAQAVREEAAATARTFLQSILNEHRAGRTGSATDDLTEEDLAVLADAFQAHGEDGSGAQAPLGQRAHATGGSGFTPVPVHLFLAADNGTFSGVHELSYIYAAMRYKTRLATPRAAKDGYGTDTCVDARFGFFKRPIRNALTAGVTQTKPVPVLAVTTGIYVTRAAACTAYVLSLPMFDIQSITFMGTAGVSPVVGGGGWTPASSVPAPPPTPPAQTQAAPGQPPRAESALYRTPAYAAAHAGPECQSEWAPSAEKVAIGSVCVTHAALLQECGICTEETPVASLCTRPHCTIHNFTTFFGPCNFKLSWRNRQFAESMKGAMMGREFPPPPPAVKVGMTKFWAANEAMPKYRRIQLDEDVSFVKTEASSPHGSPQGRAAALRYEYLRGPPGQPILLNCAEVDTSQILAGVRSDILCREYAHTLLHHEAGGGGPASDWAARKRQLRHLRGEATKEDAATPGEEMYAREQLTCVQAMEGFGFLHALIGAQLPHIPAALVRAGSNYNMYPLRKVLRPVDLDSYLTREEVLAAVKGREAGKDGNPRADAPVERPEMEESASVGAAGNQVRRLFSRPDVAQRYVAGERLRRNAQELAEARATVSGAGAANGRAEEVPSYEYVSWEHDEAFMDNDEYQQFTKAGYRYAVETASAVVLNYFLRDDGGLPGREFVKP